MANPVGPPKKPIDWNLFERLCYIQCTQEEMESILQIDRDTLMDRIVENYNDNYSAVYKRFSSGGKASLRRRQYNLTETNASMAIWLGKQWLGQTDKLDEKHMETMIHAIKTIAAFAASRPELEEVSKPFLEIEQSLPHKEQTGQKNTVSLQLGSEGTL